MDNDEIHYLVYNWPTRSKHGFNSFEQKMIIGKVKKQYPNMNMNKYNEAMTGNTCMTGPHGFIIYHCDIFTALICAVENRDMTIEEWD